MYFPLMTKPFFRAKHVKLPIGIWSVSLTKEQSDYVIDKFKIHDPGKCDCERLNTLIGIPHNDNPLIQAVVGTLHRPDVSYKKISFELFCELVVNSTAEFVLPEKWCMKIDGHKDVVRDYLMSIPDFNTDFVTNIQGYLLSSSSQLKDQSYMWWGKYSDMSYEPTEITFEQFNQYVLKENTMDKELIGYKLKEGYEQSEFKKLLQCPKFRFNDFETNGIANYTVFLSGLTKMGVLDLWFEPVYKEQFQKGDWVVGESGGDEYIGIYLSPLRTSEDMMMSEGGFWIKMTGKFDKITRKATFEEIKEAKKYKYAKEIQEIKDKAEKEIESLLK